MIINVIGTSGSGKSTLVRSVMEDYGLCRPIFVTDRKRPLYYQLWKTVEQDRPDLVVLGSYETECGGCDTIPSTDMTFHTVEEEATLARHVIFEGLLISGLIGRARAMHERYGAAGWMTLALATPLEDCLASVNARRWKRDPALEPVNPKNTQSKHGAVLSAVRQLTAAGVNVHHVPRAEALALVRRTLNG